MRWQPLIVEVGPVEAAEIEDVPRAIDQPQFRMLLRDRRVGQADVALLGSPERRGLVSVELEGAGRVARAKLLSSKFFGSTIAELILVKILNCLAQRPS